jgi:hypothetical protein
MGVSDNVLFQRFINMKNRGDSYKNIFKRLWHDFFAFQGVKKEVD